MIDNKGENMNGMEVLEIKNETTMDNQKDLELANNEYK